MALYKTPSADLKGKYLKTFETAIIISLFLIIAAFKYIPNFQTEKNYTAQPQELLTVEDVINTKFEQPPPPPPKPPIPVEAPDDKILEDEPIEPTEIDMNAPLPPPPPPPEEVDKIPDNIFIHVEELPEPVGGIEAIQRKIVYPEIAKKAGVQGKVFVAAYVDENGKVFKVELIKGIGVGCDDEALKAVMATRFKPGKQRGRPVKVKVTIPIVFKLQ